MTLLLLVPLAPVLTAALLLGLGPKLAGRGAWATVFAATVSFVTLLVLRSQAPAFSTVWLETGGLSLTVGLSLTPLSWLVGLLVAGAGVLVALYAVGYLAGEPGRARFYTALSFFIGAMLTLVLSNSLVLLFAAWEAVGLASYLLIGFWYRQDDARRAALKAFLMTRLGDLGLLLGWVWVLVQLGTTDIESLLGAVAEGAFPAAQLTPVALLFLLGAIGKSAQLPLTAWLPDAMAGPTPVSALIHSATMVAAGVYLLVRLFPLFEAAPGALAVIFWVGALTALFAALVATTQTDLKRVLAWSTVSQLGEMVLVLGLGGAYAATYHLTTHAAFKATLFLAAGAVGHTMGTYDMRQMGQLAWRMPFTALVFSAAALTLAGVPPLSAFWSAEAILAQAAAVQPLAASLMLLLIFLAGVYISRAAVSAFAPWPGAPAPKAHDPGRRMTVPLLAAALLALGVGWFLSGQLGALLELSESAPAGQLWTLWAVAASLLGLILGGWRAFRRGPVPALGSFPNLLQGALEGVTAAPVSLTWGLARQLERHEQGLDSLARRLAATVRQLAGAFDLLEVGFERSAQGLGRATRDMANWTDGVERVGFAGGGDRFATLLGGFGERLRALQSGKLYLYTLVLFTWALAVGLAGLLLWR